MYRDHSTIGSMPQEVWAHGPEQEAIRRRYIETRYRLLPYIYTLAEEAHRTGLPMVRPLFLEFPNDFDGVDTEFMFGASLLVAPPPFGEMPEGYTVAYPEGEWYDFWTGAKAERSPGQPSIVEISNTIAAGESLSKFPPPVVIHPGLDTLPVFVKAGSVVPMQPLVQSTDETPQGPLELRVYPDWTDKGAKAGSKCGGSLYLDDGHTFKFEKGEFLRQSFSCQVQGRELSVEFGARTGSYTPWWKTMEVVVFGWNSPRAVATVSGATETLKTRYDAATHALHIVLPDLAGTQELRVRE